MAMRASSEANKMNAALHAPLQGTGLCRAGAGKSTAGRPVRAPYVSLDSVSLNYAKQIPEFLRQKGRYSFNHRANGSSPVKFQ
jgi:hypothetical protein